MKTYFELQGRVQTIEVKQINEWTLGEIKIVVDQGKKGAGIFTLKAWQDKIPPQDTIGQTIKVCGSMLSNEGKNQYAGRWFVEHVIDTWSIVGQRQAQPDQQQFQPGPSAYDEKMPF